VRVNGSVAPAILFDQNTSTITSFSGETTGVVDLLDLITVKELQIMFARLVPGKVNVSLSSTNQSCFSATFVQVESRFIIPFSSQFSFSGFQSPVRCIEIMFEPNSNNTFQIADIFLKQPEASYQALIVDSSLIAAEFALDGNASTFAFASNNASSQYLLIDLNEKTQHVFGFHAELSNADAIGLYFCDDSDDVPLCEARNNFVSVPNSKVDRFMFAPVVCSRVLLVFSTQSPQSLQVNEISIFASFNLALETTASFTDSRSWINDVSKANDGDLQVPWISESDVTDSLLTFSLVPADQNISDPICVSSIEVDFLYPVDSYTVSYSVDGANYTPFTSNYFFANYIQLALLKPYVNASLEIPAWESPLFAVAELSVKTSSRLELGKFSFSNASANSSSFLSPMNGTWTAVPPAATAEIELAETTNVSGIKLSWLIRPLNFSVSFLSCGTWISTYQFISNSSEDTSATGALNVTAIRIHVTAFAENNGVLISALSSFVLFTPSGNQIQTAVPSAPALDDSPAYMVDNDPNSIYTSPLSAIAPVNIFFDFTAPSEMIGEVQIVWGGSADLVRSFEVWASLADNSSHMISSSLNNTDSVSIILMALPAVQIRIALLTTTSGQNHSFSVNEISFFAAQEFTPISAAVISGAISFDPKSAIDNNAFSMWMADPVVERLNPVSFLLDLASVFPVQEINILWGWRPSSYALEVSEDGSSFTSFNLSSTLRFLRIIIPASNADPGASLLGTSIRDIEVVLDRNLFRGKKNLVLEQPGDWWDFPPSLTADNDEDTFWLGQVGQSTASLEARFGAVVDIAGIYIDFTNHNTAAGTIEFSASLDDCVSFAPIHTFTNNTDYQVELSGQIYEFQAQCVRIVFSDPTTENIFGVSSLAIMRHVGGGGLFAIEARVNGSWGTVFDSIAFAPFQPAQWAMLSNQQLRTEEVNGSLSFDEISNLVQLVATFSDNQITLYRNGVIFGSPYSTNPIAWDMVEDVRLVLGVRSSAFVNANQSGIDNLMGSFLPGNRVSTLSPFFHGQIQSATLFSRTLLPEEVQGLYLSATLGVRERGCLCYDSCPTGTNYHYPDVSVPCSGQGVCLRQYDPSTGLPIAGQCRCSPGFSGINCAIHCSQNGGCCSVDDDCPLNRYCDPSTYSCVMT
jgi:hypothetical protein